MLPRKAHDRFAAQIAALERRVDTLEWANNYLVADIRMAGMKVHRPPRD